MINLREQPWQTLYQAAEFAVAQEHWLAAEPLLLNLLAQVPHHASAFHLLGKVRRATDQLEAALEAQQRSCELDPGLGWNWFAAGELLLELKRWGEAAQAFEHAQAALPAEGWIKNQLATALWLQQCQGERFVEGLGPQTYRYWIERHEPRLPSACIALSEPFWCLKPFGEGQQSWLALHSSAPLQPLRAPLGHSPWPMDGWLVLLGEGASLRPGSLQAVERFLVGERSNQEAPPLPDVLYSDEDRLDQAGQRCDPWFKPGWSDESFWSSPWLNALSFWRLSWLRDRQVPLPPADQAGRWCWQLKTLEQRPQISHVPLILVHAGPPSRCPSEPLRQHLVAQGERIQHVRHHPELPGSFQLQWQLPQTWSCSVIIPTRDRADLLKQCLNSLWTTSAVARSKGLDLEILVVDNGSVEPATFDLFEQWKQRLRVLRCDEPFNWSRLNNLAAKQAKGDLLLLLNNDIEAFQTGWLEAMVGQALRPDIGAVGALLLYPDGSIQHGGVVVGLSGKADHAYRNMEPHHGVHRGRSRLLTCWGAVTGACLMLRRELLERVGGLDEGLPVEFNDVDLCLQLSQLGYRCVIPPEAVLVHHESQSRDARESTTALQALLRVQRRWPGRFSSAAPWWPAQCERNCADGRPIGLEDLPV